MAIIAKDPDKNLPPSYRTFDQCGLPIEEFPFPGGLARVHRFAARYRFAKEFQMARFETFSSGTAAGYSALCKYQFTYGAFEALLRALGIGRDIGALGPALAKYPHAKWDAAIRAAPTHRRFFEFLTWHLKPGLRDQCRLFLARKPYDPLLLATAVRNSFAHGHLTPSANRTEPEDTVRICSVFSGALVAIMDHEFSTRVNNTLANFLSEDEQS
jgi:hypothetical protein